MKLVLYSGGSASDNRQLDLALIELSRKKNPRVTYIPSSSEWGETYYDEFVEQYRKYGVKDFYYFPIDMAFSPGMLKEAFRSDIVYLSGGNTFYFLKQLKKTKVFEAILEHVHEGKVLGGLSAGAILMTPNIGTANFPDFDRDDNEVNLKRLTALNLLPFEFFPHFTHSKRYFREMCEYTELTEGLLYACEDGGGIVVNEHEIRFIGQVHGFKNGVRFKVSL